MKSDKTGKIDILLFVDETCAGHDLMFQNEFLPESLGKKFIETGFFNEVYITVHESFDHKIDDTSRVIIRKGGDDVEFWKNFFNEKKSDHAVRISADSPFIDPAVIIEMLEVHTGQFAEYTFSENLPQGLTAEIISSDLIEALPEIKEQTLPLPQVVKSNINHFDVEIFYKDPDIRDKRLSFLSSSRRDRKIMENILTKEGTVPSYESLKSIIESDPAILYIGPSYVEIEPTGRCSLNCVFCYRKKLETERGDMPVDVYESILAGMEEFGLPYSICMGGSGEPLMCGSIYEMMKKAVSNPLVETLVIETNGIDAGGNFRSFLETPETSKVKVIVNINGYDRDTYSSLHGSDSFDTVFANVKSLAELNSSGSDRVYVQLMKINETKDFTDRYYDFWESHGLPIIFQKHNKYLNLIEDRSYSDLSPIERMPCWHLQRDLFIASDGTAAFCKQDVALKKPIGSVSEKSLKDIFESGRDRFLKDYKGDLSKSPDCSLCDEWYTFNL